MDDLESTKKRALKILGSRNFSEHEMFKRLTGKGETEENSAQAVRWLVELGYINDPEYATLIVRHYSAKGYGAARIRDELYRRGISKELQEEKLDEINDDQIGDAALEFLKKRLRGSEEKDDLRRAREALVRRGFSFDDARSAVNRYLECPE